MRRLLPPSLPLPRLLALALAGAAALCAAARADPVSPAPPQPLYTLSALERLELARTAPSPELAERLRATPVPDLLTLAHQSLASIGTYSARMTKQERVGGDLIAPQTVDLTVREKPLAALLRYVEGPSAGRVVLYSEELRKGALRAREPGLKGLIGALWVDLDSSLTRGDTNHRATDVGFGAVLRLIEGDLAASAPLGGRIREDEGFDEGRGWCIRFHAPAGVKGLPGGEQTRICFDIALGLPVLIEVSAGGRLLERYLYERVETNRAVAPDFFTPQAAGL